MFCAYTRPRYQVSVYTTIDPLNLSFCLGFLSVYVMLQSRVDLYQRKLFLESTAWLRKSYEIGEKK